MKASSNTKSSNIIMSNSKTKKSREREKRKSSSNEKTDQHSEKGSPTKDGSTRKYAGLGPDSIVIYSEQTSYEQLSEDVCSGLAEDISYKLRYVIHDALTKARLCGRNYIQSADIESTFEHLNIEPVYGATFTPNFLTLDKENLFYLDDPVVNLVDLSEQTNSYLQPSQIIVTRKWIPDNKDVSIPLRNYFETICYAVVSNEIEVRQTALHDLQINNYIGPIVEWFYHFGYFLLSKDITYDCLTLSALDLIRTLEANCVAPQIVSEKQLKLLVRLILQRLLRSPTTIEVLKPMCNILAILCDRLPIRELVALKIIQKMPEAKGEFALPVITIINNLGKQAVYDLLEENLNYFLVRVEQDEDASLSTALLQTYYLMGMEWSPKILLDVYKNYYNIFGDSLLPLWKIPINQQKVDQPESNWRNIKAQLLKTRRKIPHNQKIFSFSSFHTAFPDYVEHNVPPRIKFKFYDFFPTTGTEKFVNMCISQRSSNTPNYVTVGKRTMSHPMKSRFKISSIQCSDYNMNMII